jgi:hypothetical protein
MPAIGIDDPTAREHRCNVPAGVFHKRWTVWQCPVCGQCWRKEPPDYADMDSWTYHQYNPKPIDVEATS